MKTEGSMQSRDFCFWLQGFFELGGGDRPITAEQAVLIRRHLDLVFLHEIDQPLRIDQRLPIEMREKPAPVPNPVAPPRPAPEPDRDPLPEPPYPPSPPPRC
jgi:hypothetical protein